MNKDVLVHVLSKVEFHSLLEGNKVDDENVDEFISHAFISINDSSGEYYNKAIFHRNHHNVLTLWFDDVIVDNEPSPTNQAPDTKAFSKEQAKQIIEFVNENQNAKGFIIHCAAGISRSGAVGQWIIDLFEGDQGKFERTNPHIFPNGYIIRTLNETYKNSK